MAIKHDSQNTLKNLILFLQTAIFQVILPIVQTLFTCYDSLFKFS